MLLGELLKDENNSLLSAVLYVTGTTDRQIVSIALYNKLEMLVEDLIGLDTNLILVLNGVLVLFFGAPMNVDILILELFLNLLSVFKVLNGL